MILSKELKKQYRKDCVFHGFQEYFNKLDGHARNQEQNQET